MSIHFKDPQAIDVIHILVRATHSIQREFKTQFSSLDIPFQITGPRLRVLSTVSEVGKIRMNELAAKLGIQARTVTDLVDALEKDNLLIRSPDPTDRRATRLQLTELAQAHLSEALSKQTEIAEKLVQGLTQEQRSQFLELLLHLFNEKELPSACEDDLN
ncbi:MarR family transcriptional regulator [Paenibacillus filicis]|uniref:MarR family transcriptional regulator n=1 Tax=Paenibacillus gyeongsangnamensis TaxID=3388067 RepID=A0ABT4Q2H0_9BACL|nr:MarR family transcriptional regulator [Paenibacillus filicis]MCZ8510895.1 MarR family transcriptional regulator [Paenibacillus filicis]